MPRRIDEDHKDFHDVYSGRKRKELKKFIHNGNIFRNRGKNGKIIVTIPKIDIPHIVYGSGGSGVGRGKGEKGDVIGKDDEGGKGSGAGQGKGDGIDISVDLDEILRFMQEELQLPDMKPKPSDTYEEVIKKYNNISLVGPESLRHTKKTLMQALKRQCSDGSINKLHTIPGVAQPIRLITPINSDKRYRQFNEIHIPASNAVIFFARDGSGSMDQYKCDIVSDMSWWIDVWIRKFYKKVERCYIWHDTEAKELDEQKFYKHRYGGGTTCSSALKLMSKIIENRFNPRKWNIYIFYFTDGDNWGDDNNQFCHMLEQDFKPDMVNLFALTQILPYQYNGTVKQAVDSKVGHISNIRTTSIESDAAGYGATMSDSERDLKVRDAIMEILGKEKVKK